MLLLGVVHLLLNTAAALLGGALLLRVYLSWLRIAAHNPLVQLSWALTEWLVKAGEFGKRFIMPLRFWPKDHLKPQDFVLLSLNDFAELYEKAKEVRLTDRTWVDFDEIRRYGG